MIIHSGTFLGSPISPILVVPHMYAIVAAVWECAQSADCAEQLLLGKICRLHNWANCSMNNLLLKGATYRSLKAICKSVMAI